jgi:hypothetical protein
MVQNVTKSLVIQIEVTPATTNTVKLANSVTANQYPGITLYYQDADGDGELDAEIWTSTTGATGIPVGATVYGKVTHDSWTVADYYDDNITISGATKETATGYDFKFQMPAANVTITNAVTAKNFTVTTNFKLADGTTVSSVYGGTNGATTATYTALYTSQITLPTGYELNTGTLTTDIKAYLTSDSSQTVTVSAGTSPNVTIAAGDVKGNITLDVTVKPSAVTLNLTLNGHNVTFYGSNNGAGNTEGTAVGSSISGLDITSKITIKVIGTNNPPTSSDATIRLVESGTIGNDAYYVWEISNMNAATTAVTIAS